MWMERSVVVVAFSSRARIFFFFFENVRHSPPALFVVVRFCFVFLVELSLHTIIPLFYARISPQWLSELRRL